MRTASAKDCHNLRCVSGARQRSDGVEKYSSIASRQTPEHGSAASSPRPDSRISAATFSAQLMQTLPRSFRSPCSCNSTREMSVRGSRSLRLHADSDAARGQSAEPSKKRPPTVLQRRRLAERLAHYGP
jgi:hypothetical protein